MSVLFTRVGVPTPGRQGEALKYAKARAEYVNKTFGIHAEVRLRFGGSVGQVVMLEKFDTLADIEKLKQATVKATLAGDGAIPIAPAGVFQSIEEGAWIDV